MRGKLAPFMSNQACTAYKLIDDLDIEYGIFNKKEHEWSVYFDIDKETVILNLGNPEDDDFVKEGHGWKVGK
eukprot:SAG25_NODE_103_length_15482_cov_9.187415_7_plen_72_part_00